MPKSYAEESTYADRCGYAILPDGYQLLFTLNGLPVAQPNGLGDRNYPDLADAERSGCLILRPDLFSCRQISYSLFVNFGSYFY